MSKQKFIIYGALVGVVCGCILYFIVPSLMEMELQLNVLTNQRLGRDPFYYSPSGGSVFAIGFFVPFVMGIVGAGLGYLAYKLLNKKSS